MVLSFTVCIHTKIAKVLESLLQGPSYKKDYSLQITLPMKAKNLKARCLQRLKTQHPLFWAVSCQVDPLTPS